MHDGHDEISIHMNTFNMQRGETDEYFIAYSSVHQIKKEEVVRW